MADATFLFVKARLNFATLELTVFSVSAMFVEFAYMWGGVGRFERLAVLGRGNPVSLPTVAATICLFLALSGVTHLLYPHPNEVSYSEFYVTDTNRQTAAYQQDLTQGTSSAFIRGMS
jgi:hypothetical protein